ncbi:MAG: hypothetical protein OEY86_10580 [Nitrospira sp.]|nr:hypothetical protein [Nitrospira sp.]
MPSLSLKPLIFRDNSEWLRYLLLAGAVGMCVLVFNLLTGAEGNVGKVIGGTLGAFLLAFSGYVLQVRRLVIDPIRLEISVTSKGLASTVTDRFGFSEVLKLLVVLTYDRDEELSPATRQGERWSVLFLLKNRSIPVTVNPYTSKEQAMCEARRIQQLLRVEISDNLEEGLNQLAQTGRTIDAVVVARQQLGMTLAQAKEYSDQAGNGRDSPISVHKLKPDHHLG